MKIAFLLDKDNNWIEPFVELYVKNNSNFNIFYNHIDVVNYDIVFILAYTKILDNKFLKSNNLNLVVHESDLPKGKGFSPIQWQILEGKNEIIFTLFEAIETLDAGDIYSQEKISLEGHELFEEIRMLQGETTIKLIDNFLNSYPNIEKKVQKGKESFYAKRKSEDDKIDIDKSIKDQFNHFRIAQNNEYPLWFEIDGHRYTLKVFKDDYVR